MEGIQKPKVDRIQNVAPTILISQKQTNKNPRSSVGTVTDMYTNLRMIYEKLAERSCPHCKARIKASECKEDVEKGPVRHAKD